MKHCLCNKLEPMPMYEKIINMYHSYSVHFQPYFSYDHLSYNDTRLIVEKSFNRMIIINDNIINKILNEKAAINEAGDYKINHESTASISSTPIQYKLFDEEWFEGYIEEDNKTYVSYNKPYKLTIKDIKEKLINHEHCLRTILERKLTEIKLDNIKYHDTDVTYILYDKPPAFEMLQKCRMSYCFDINYLLIRYNLNLCIIVGFNNTFKIIKHDENFHCNIGTDIIIMDIRKHWEIQFDNGTRSMINIPTINKSSTSDEAIIELQKLGYTWKADTHVDHLC